MADPRQSDNKWGLLPAEVKRIITAREWTNTANLKARLSGNKSFPIKLSLRPPPARAAIADLHHFQQFVEQWRCFHQQKFVQWQSKNFRNLLNQSIPKLFVLSNMADLIEFIGGEAKVRTQIWSANMSPLLKLDKDIYPALVKHLHIIEQISVEDAQLLAELLSQLSPQMGAGQYLRSLPLVGVDTKFLENHQALVADLLDILHQGAVSTAGGLLPWLGCVANPKGWLTIRPLCDSAAANMGNFPLLQIAGDLLQQCKLPAANILIVENLQSGLGLPELTDTIAIIGCGKNTAWLNAAWLNDKRVAYWGDIDTWGLLILSDVRARLGNIIPLMMDHETLHLHEDRMVTEPTSVDNCPPFLTASETKLFHDLKSNCFKASRLEQERLSADYIQRKLQEWLSNA